MTMRTFTGFILLLILSASCSQQPEEAEHLTDYPNAHLLLDASELHEQLEQNDIFLIDARDEPGDTLIPGAAHFSAIYELTDHESPIASYLIGPEPFQEKMRELGLNNDDRVVIYDAGNSLAAARLFYALDYYGFSGATLLDGGLAGWLEQGLPVTNEAVVQVPGNFSFNVQDGRFCDFEYVMEAAASPDKIVFDVRSAGEYIGEDQRAELGGHIPNAVNLEWNNVLQPEGVPYFLPADEIRQQYAALGITPDKEVIPHCHTNVRGSHAYFTLRLMGYDSVRPYEGSWAEYGNHPDAVVQ